MKKFVFFYKKLRTPFWLFLSLSILLTLASIYRFHTGFNYYNGEVIIRNFSDNTIFLESFEIKRPQYVFVKDIKSKIGPKQKAVVRVNVFMQNDEVEPALINKLKINDKIFEKCKADLSIRTERRIFFDFKANNTCEVGGQS